MRNVLALVWILSIYGCQPVFAQKEGEAVRAHFKQAFTGATSLISDEVNYDSSKVIIGYPDYYITQDISHVAIAQREGRVFVNPDVNALPDGDYTFILTSAGDLEFGLISHDLEIGVKHFQLAEGRALFAAGEFTKHEGRHRLSIKSGTFSRHLKSKPGYSEPETMKKLEKAFEKLWGLKMKMEFETLYADPEEIELAVLERFCVYPEFLKFHEKTLCLSYLKRLEEAAQLEACGRIVLPTHN
jgi:hypothetical protein